MKQLIKIVPIFLTVVFCQLGGLLYAQGNGDNHMALTFFMEKAREDAVYEQNIQLLLPEDEMDFWKDQRNYERALKKKSYSAYQVYLNTKLEAYNNHSFLCESPNQHGEQYFLQAKFYAIYGKTEQISYNTTADNIRIN